jgi:hypothetical protein
VEPIKLLVVGTVFVNDALRGREIANNTSEKTILKTVASCLVKRLTTAMLIGTNVMRLTPILTFNGTRKSRCCSGCV